MGYSAEVIKRARRQLESDNAQAQARSRARLQQAYQTVPQLKQLDMQLRRSMVYAAQAAFAQAGNGQSIMEEAKQANLALQKQRQALLDAHFEPGFLEQDALCPHCGGSGYIGSTMCRCLDALCRAEQKREVSLLSCGATSFADFRLDYYPDRTIPGTDINMRSAMAKTLDICKQYAQNFPAEQSNLLFSGDTGLGKTFLSACIASAVTDKGHCVTYESAPRLFAQLEKARFAADPEQRSEAEACCGKYYTCDLLIVDDLGTELSGQFVTSALYSLINERLLSGKATIISTNLNNQALEERYSSQILSRLRGSFRRVTFVGDDIRILKNKGVLA